MFLHTRTGNEVEALEKHVNFQSEDFVQPLIKKSRVKYHYPGLHLLSSSFIIGSLFYFPSERRMSKAYTHVKHVVSQSQ